MIANPDDLAGASGNTAAAHTPGPWHSVLASDKTWHVGDKSGFQVALVKVASALTAPRRDADARLIAAAPELLAQLKQARSLLLTAQTDVASPLGKVVIERHVVAMSAVIDKATKTQPSN